MRLRKWNAIHREFTEIFFFFLKYFIQHCIICRPHIPLCPRILRLNHLQLWVGTYRSGTHRPRDESSKGRIVHGTHRPWEASSMGRIVHGTNRPWDESSKSRIVQEGIVQEMELLRTLTGGHIIRGHIVMASLC